MLAEAELVEAVIDVVEDEDGGGEHEVALGVGDVEGLGELRLKDGGHFVAPVAVESAGDGGELGLFGLDVQQVEGSAHAVHVGLAAQFAEGGEVVTVGFDLELAAVAEEFGDVIGGDDAVASPSPVDFCAFEEDGLGVAAAQLHEESNGCLRVAFGEAAALLVEGDGACHGL